MSLASFFQKSKEAKIDFLNTKINEMLSSSENPTTSNDIKFQGIIDIKYAESNIQETMETILVQFAHNNVFPFHQHEIPALKDLFISAMKDRKASFTFNIVAPLLDYCFGAANFPRYHEKLIYGCLYSGAICAGLFACNKNIRTDEIQYFLENEENYSNNIITMIFERFPNFVHHEIERKISEFQLNFTNFLTVISKFPHIIPSKYKDQNTQYLSDLYHNSKTNSIELSKLISFLFQSNPPTEKEKIYTKFYLPFISETNKRAESQRNQSLNRFPVVRQSSSPVDIDYFAENSAENEKNQYFAKQFFSFRRYQGNDSNIMLFIKLLSSISHNIGLDSNIYFLINWVFVNKINSKSKIVLSNVDNALIQTVFYIIMNLPNNELINMIEILNSLTPKHYFDSNSKIQRIEEIKQFFITKSRLAPEKVIALQNKRLYSRTLGLKFMCDSLEQSNNYDFMKDVEIPSDMSNCNMIGDSNHWTDYMKEMDRLIALLIKLSPTHLFFNIIMKLPFHPDLLISYFEQKYDFIYYICLVATRDQLFPPIFRNYAINSNNLFYFPWLLIDGAKLPIEKVVEIPINNDFNFFSILNVVSHNFIENTTNILKKLIDYCQMKNDYFSELNSLFDITCINSDNMMKSIHELLCKTAVKNFRQLDTIFKILLPQDDSNRFIPIVTQDFIVDSKEVGMFNEIAHLPYKDNKFYLAHESSYYSFFKFILRLMENEQNILSFKSNKYFIDIINKIAESNFLRINNDCMKALIYLNPTKSIIIKNINSIYDNDFTNNEFISGSYYKLLSSYVDIEFVNTNYSECRKALRVYATKMNGDLSEFHINFYNIERFVEDIIELNKIVSIKLDFKKISPYQKYFTSDNAYDIYSKTFTSAPDVSLDEWINFAKLEKITPDIVNNEMKNKFSVQFYLAIASKLFGHVEEKEIYSGETCQNFMVESTTSFKVGTKIGKTMFFYDREKIKFKEEKLKILVFSPTNDTNEMFKNREYLLKIIDQASYQWKIENNIKIYLDEPIDAPKFAITMKKAFAEIARKLGIGPRLDSFCKKMLEQAVLKGSKPTVYVSRKSSLAFFKNQSDGLPMIDQVFNQCDLTDFRSGSFPFEVNCVDEGSIDAGGPRRQIFTDICNEIISPETKIFIDPGFCQGLVPLNEHPSRLKFAGFMFALCIAHKLPYPFNLNFQVFRYLAQETINTDDIIHYYDENLSKSVKIFNSRTWTDEEFEANPQFKDLQYFIGLDGMVNELNPPITKDNFYESIQQIAKFRLSELAIPMEHVIEGFSIIFPTKNQYYSTVIQQLCCGDNDIPVSDIINSINFDCKDSLKNKFLQAFARLEPQEKRQLLIFISGKASVSPYSKDKIKIIYQDTYKTNLEAPLPTSATCFMKMYLPNYDTVEIMLQKLRIAMNEITITDYQSNFNNGIV